MRNRMSALLVGIAALTTTLAVGQPAAMAGTERVPRSQYTVEVQTGAMKDADTNAEIELFVDGSNGDLEWGLLANGQDTFKRRALDRFRLETAGLGTIGRICVRSGKGSDWYPEWIRIGDRIALFNDWLKPGAQMCRNTDLGSLRTIEVKTGSPDWAGTESDVEIYLHGSKRDVGWMRLDNDQTNFRRNEHDVFQLLMPEMGTIERICVHTYVKSDDWYLEWVKFGGRIASFYKKIPSGGNETCRTAGVP